VEDIPEILDLAHTHPPTPVDVVDDERTASHRPSPEHTRGRAVMRRSAVVALVPVATTDDQGKWFADYLDRVAGLVADAGHVNARLAGEWGARSLREGDWTVDTLAADVIEAWDRLTPLAERGLELWLELVQQAIRSGDRS
jgi:hypothetical protein